MADIEVHKTHCCILHGCKYRDNNCPVITEQIKQIYSCEECYSMSISSIEELNNLLEVKELLNKKTVCPKCGHEFD